MKKILIVILLLGIVVACGKENEKKERIYTDQLQIKNSLGYKANQKEPYTGDVISIYPSGVLKEELYVKNGKREGLAKSFYPNGQLKEELNFKDGVANGVKNEYYSNGQLKEEANFINGEFDGIRKRYYESGKLYSEEVFINGDLEEEKYF